MRFRFVPDDVKFIQGQQIYRTFIDKGGSVAGTLKALNYEGMPRSSRGLKLWLENVANLGHTRYIGRVTRSGKTIPDELVENTHKAMIDEATFNQAKLFLAEKNTGQGNRTRNLPPHPLQGVLRCPVCGNTTSVASKVYKTKGGNIGCKPNAYKPGEARVFYAHSCRYRPLDRCNVDPDTGCFKKPMVDQLKDEAWQILIDRADQLANLRTATTSEITKEELELMTGIKQLEQIPGDAMKPHIESMKAQLDQYKFKREGKIRAGNTKAHMVRQMNLSVRAFNELPFDEQNELMKTFFHRIVPPYGNNPAIIDCVF